MPLQLFSLFGMLVAVASVFAYVIVIANRWIASLRVSAEGVRAICTLFASQFFLIGITLFGIGLLGEYVGRIYEQVRQRPRYLIDAILDGAPPAARRTRAPSSSPTTTWACAACRSCCATASRSRWWSRTATIPARTSGSRASPRSRRGTDCPPSRPRTRTRRS